MKNGRLKIGIFGLGLIGGSILKGLCNTGKYELRAVSKSSYKEAIEYAHAAGDDISLLTECDVVFVCSKMNETAEVLSRLEKILPTETIVSDVCSLKGFLVRDYNFNYIGGHPMAGTEKSGFKASFDGLFRGAKWIINKHNDILEEIILTLGAKPLVIDPFEHDILAAQISHLPMLLSTSLFNLAEDNALKIASSGFRDTTRLAMTNKDLAYDMLNLNRKNILAAYKKFLDGFENILKKDEKDFKEFMELCAKKRALMYDENGVNKF